MTIRIGIFLLALTLPGFARVAPKSGAYTSNFGVVLRLGGELYEALPPKYGDQLDAQAIALQPQDLPIVAPIATTDDNRVLRQVSLSAGFIDMVNHICHAKAIDRIQPGYFDHYVKNIAQLCSSNDIAAAPAIVEPRFWTPEVMNDQQSYFNQVIGLVTAINLSHHYLGHYAKYASRLTSAGANVVPINNLLTPREWEVSVKAAALDSLTCALATDGPRALFEAIDRMPTRPSWTAYIVPRQVNIKRLNKELAAYEKDFFHGQLR
jgi:hypothetical protein